MITVYTKEELRRAIECKNFPIECRGEIATQLRKRKKASKAAKVGGVLLIAGSLLTLPFTGGASAAGLGAGVMGLTIGEAVTISTAELAILVGGGVALTAIIKGRSVELRPDGSVIVK